MSKVVIPGLFLTYKLGNTSPLLFPIFNTGFNSLVEQMKIQQKITKIYKRKLYKAWLYTEEHKETPDPLIKKLFSLAIKDCQQRRYIKKYMSFKHSLQDGSVKHVQKYRVTGLGRLVLIPPETSWLSELPSNIGVL